MAEPFDTLMVVQDHDITIDQLRHRIDSLPERSELAEVRKRQSRARRGHVRGRGAGGRPGRAASAGWRSRSRPPPADGTRSSRGCRPARSPPPGICRPWTGRCTSWPRGRQQFEEDEIALLEEEEPLDMRWPRSRPSRASLAAEAARLEAAIAEAEQEITVAIASEEAARAESAARLPDDLAARYDVLRARLGGVGAARLVGDRCDGCHLTLSSVEIERIRRLPPDEFATCPQCDRILVH